MAANRQTDKHMHVCNAVMLVWGSLRLVPITLNTSAMYLLFSKCAHTLAVLPGCHLSSSRWSYVQRNLAVPKSYYCVKLQCQKHMEKDVHV